MSGFIRIAPGLYEWRGGEPGSAIPVWVPDPPRPTPEAENAAFERWFFSYKTGRDSLKGALHAAWMARAGAAP